MNDFNKELFSSMLAIGMAIIGLASLAIFISKNSNTVGVIQAAGGAFNDAIGTAISPVTAYTPLSGGTQLNFGNGSIGAGSFG